MDRRPIKYNPSGKYNLDFIDWNNEWERVGEIAAKLENGEPVSDEEEAERVRRHMEIEENKFGVNINNFEILKKNDIPTNKECYICLKNFKKSDTIRKLPCGHFFCEKCIKPWLTKIIIIYSIKIFIYCLNKYFFLIYISQYDYE